MRTLFKGGTVVSGTGTKRADLLIENEKIVESGRNLKADADKVVDVTGCFLFPGFIDAHTHFDLDVCNTTTADDFYTGSRAALRGGTTTVIDFACPNKGESLHYGLDLWHKKADGRTVCDYGFHMTIDDWNESIRAELPDMFAKGISSFKMYMTYPAMMVGDRDMYWALKELKSLGGLCGVHCENAGVIDGMSAERKNSGQVSPACHPLTRPPYLEAEAVRRSMWRLAPSTCCWTTACTSTRITPRRHGTSVRRPSGTRANRPCCGRPCGGVTSRPSPPTTAPSPWSRKTRAGRTSPRSPAVCPAWKPVAS